MSDVPSPPDHLNSYAQTIWTGAYRQAVQDCREELLAEVNASLTGDEAVLAGARRLFGCDEPSMDQLWDVLKTIRAVSAAALPPLSVEASDGSRRRVQFKVNGHLGTVIGESHGLVRVVWDKASREAGEPKDSWVQPDQIETLGAAHCGCGAGETGDHWAPCPLAEPTAESSLAELSPAI